jgi:nucleoid-associated protein YgaU
LENGFAMGRDYRMGLVAGSILAGVALLWVATRPGLAPRPQPAQASPGGNRDLPGVGGPGAASDTGSATQADRPKTVAQKMEERSTSQSVRRPPSSVGRDLSAGSPNLPGRQKTAPPKATRVHIVRQGETLSGIAQQYYGSSNDWRKILTANEKTIKDANKIAPGTKLLIPE